MMGKRVHCLQGNKYILSATVDPESVALLDAIAKISGLNRSDLVQKAIWEFLDRLGVEIKEYCKLKGIELKVEA